MWKTPGTSFSFCCLIGCSTSGIDQQVGKSDTRQRKSVREAELETKLGGRGINDSQLYYSRLCLKWLIVRLKDSLFQTPWLSVHMWLRIHLPGVLILLPFL